MDRNILQPKIAAAPSAIRDWFGSEACVEAIGKVNDQFNIIGENSRIIPRLLLRLEIKDISPGYFSGALAVALNTDKNHVAMIVGEIKKTILAPVEKDFANYDIDLALLDKFEIPITKPVAPAPKVLEEIHAVSKVPISTPMPVPFTAPATKISVIVPSASKQESAKLITEKITPSLDEFSGIGKNPVPIASPAPTPAPAPKPFILQMSASSVPIPNAPNFRVPTTAENIMGGRKGPEPLPMRSAVVEFGNMPIPKPATKPAAPLPATTPKVTVVRYGSEKSVPPAPPKPEPMRTVIEITPETLKTVAPIQKMPAQPSFAPLSQIPVPSPMMPAPSRAEGPKPPVATMPAVSSIPKPQTPALAPIKPVSPTPPAPPKPLPEIPKPAAPSEKIITKDYSETGK